MYGAMIGSLTYFSDFKHSNFITCHAVMHEYGFLQPDWHGHYLQVNEKILRNLGGGSYTR